MVDEVVELPSCPIHTCFRLRHGWVKVVQDLAINTDYLMAKKHITKVVLLGSLDHQNALFERIVELEGRLSQLSSEPTFLTSPAANPQQQARANQDECRMQGWIERLREEMGVRMRELQFIRQNCPVASGNEAEDTDADEEDELMIPHSITDDTGLETLAHDSSLPSSAGISSSEIITVTHKTFGEVGMLKEYTIKRKEKLFRRPRYRQFFLGPILHRSTEEMKTSWTEIFVDLLYVGVLAKAGELVRGDQSWDAFSKFCLVVIPCLAHWNAYTLYNNQIHHEDLYAKVLVNVIMISIMVMGNSLKNAFNPVPELNTSTIFIISYICERLFIIGSQVVVTAYFHSEFWLFNGLQAITRFAIMIPYFVLLGLPVNGDPARETVRLSIWYVGAAMELFLPLLGIATFRIVMMFVSVDDRPAVNIEHMAERQGALFVIALGVVAVSFLFDARSSVLQSVMGLMILAITIGINLNHLYFRSESGDHYKHALRRVWYTGILWQFIHIPLVTATLSLGAIMSEIIAVTFLEAEGSESSERLHSDYKNIFFVSLAAIYACFLVLRLSHQEHPDPKPKTEKQASSKRVQSRQRGANLSQTGKAALIMGWLALILGLGLGLSEEQWTPYRMFGFATGVTMASVVLMEWGHLRKAKRERASL